MFKVLNATCRLICDRHIPTAVKKIISERFAITRGVFSFLHFFFLKAVAAACLPIATNRQTIASIGNGKNLAGFLCVKTAHLMSAQTRRFTL